MIRYCKLAGCLIVVALLGGCATYMEIPPAKQHQIGGVLAVQPSSAWSALKTERGEIWTVNGFGLDRMAFITKVADGEPLLTSSQDKDAPTFRADMNATDVVDLYEAMLIANGYSRVEVTNLRPHSISGRDGFRFDYAGYDSNGLAKRGMVVGLIDAETGLNLVLYEAAAEHYYDASLSSAEEVIASLARI